MIEVKLELENNLHIKIITDSRKYMIGIYEYFTQHVEGFQFMPQYRAGSWDGKVCMINKATNTIPYGLLFDYIRIHKKYFKNTKLSISDEVKQLFKGQKFIPRYNLSLKPYPYQKECIRACLNYTKGIIRSATASGKSLIISYIIKTLLDRKNSNVTNAIIVVPNKQLVEQFYKDMIEYGIEENNIGRVYQKYKQWDNSITISTWQTLKNNHDKLLLYDCIIVDECLDGETNIKTINGIKKIKDIKKGDGILSYNKKLLKFEGDIVDNIYVNLKKSSKEKMYKLFFDNGDSINITGNHKILTKTGYIRADKLSLKDEIITL